MAWQWPGEGEKALAKSINISSLIAGGRKISGRISESGFFASAADQRSEGNWRAEQHIMK